MLLREMENRDIHICIYICLVDGVVCAADKVVWMCDQDGDKKGRKNIILGEGKIDKT